ncbi:MAG: NACHT domain-containing protein [Proteobacteria bacterium]|nr:NACHT domain-containing protein [Pseudomonadota bacterium]
MYLWSDPNHLPDPSLWGKVAITHGFHMVERPWDTVLQQSDYTPKVRPIANINVVDVFGQAGGELLILGEPGSGKTSVLLKLAYDLAAFAEQEQDALFIPVVFSLSSWTKKQRPISNWLVDQLYVEYQIPPKTGQSWVNDQRLVLLLDDLDQVTQKYRPKCVKAVNHFHQHYGLVKIVICSRTVEYEALSVRLNLQDAIVLQPPHTFVSWR